jgi:DNA replication and repair protein RecF
VQLEHLWLTDFRNYRSAELLPAPNGLTVVTGANGEGKTNLLEAIAYLATLKSFRGAPPDALIRTGAACAVVRAEGHRDGRALLIEAERRAEGRDRVLVNRQPLKRARDLLGALRTTVFSPDDLAIVKGGPALRREYLDDLLVAVSPKYDAMLADLERVLRQRNTLLRQAGLRQAGTGAGRPLGEDVARTLDVWDEKLADLGTAVAAARTELCRQLEPEAGKAYDALAGSPAAVGLSYRPSWDGALVDAVAGARLDDLRRGVTTVGPHRDDVVLTIGAMPVRTHASQGEQRTVALALRLAGHGVVSEAVGTPPILLLDDVFSELDQERAAALVAHLPEGQAILTTAGVLPPAARPAAVFTVRGAQLDG